MNPIVENAALFYINSAVLKIGEPYAAAAYGCFSTISEIMAFLVVQKGILITSAVFKDPEINNCFFGSAKRLTTNDIGAMCQVGLTAVGVISVFSRILVGKALCDRLGSPITYKQIVALGTVYTFEHLAMRGFRII